MPLGPSYDELSAFLRVGEQAARAGGAALRSWAGRFAVREKGPADLVTEADLASQEAVRQAVLKAYPDHGVLGEEGAEHAGRSAYRWIVDPLDGTTNYVHALPQFAVSLALELEGDLLVGVVYDPAADECFTAAKGLGAHLNGQPLKVSTVTDPAQALVAASFAARVERDSPQVAQFVEMLVTVQAVRRLGSAALNLSYLAAGRLDGYWAADNKIWDVAAGVLLVREAGGVITGLNGGPLILAEPRLLAASTAELHQGLASILERVPGQPS